MGEKVFMQGNQAMAESAIRAGCKLYFGYPITPSSEVPEYYAKAMRERPEEHITFIQAETEVSAFNMVAGAAATGHRAMTATSGPGFSLGQEAMSYMAAGDIPGVIVEVMRPGPGDADILAAQGDYFQAVKGGGHGDYNNLVLAPYSVQELCDLMQESFELAEKYHNPVILLSDATLAKMREAVELPGYVDEPAPADKYNALRGCGKDKEPHKVVTCGDGPVQWEQFNLKLQEKFKRIKDNEVRYETYNMDDADIILVAYGSMARVCESAMKMAREEGLKVGMIRPISLWPFPEKAFEGITGKKFLVCELSAGQMVEDVKLAVENKRDVSFFGKLGGTTPSPKVILEQIKKI
ncbi:2-oxoglutarate ferredoxin oxidoreductase, alpha subunit [Oscillibacter sp. PC13]|uniref:3-methyl-2-oxobutanoate dehydrogenase subunit VorB n=1 Tax=Oscillibacter sp. PC13 TaxID=1855299 RepID=UPI0008E49B8D|nr:3-methyl-2-oxobutanoate dehydrogenase subunit VorB [Oscillibacter sp. PC13]SFQ20770.1 2-oxoglutarate ferredoxin oxidoreductase, alpha subunit [Oscillibacter sp. PC13]